MKVPFLIGRLMFGGFFIYSGINHIVNRKQLAEYSRAKKVPKPEAAVIATGAMMIAGGTSVALGIKPKLGTIAILGFLASVSPIMHDFWRAEDPNQRQTDMIHFAKNLALLGASVALMGVEEPWPVSVPVLQPSVRKQLEGAWKGNAAA
jgi:putative oxidoreductase